MVQGLGRFRVRDRNFGSKHKLFAQKDTRSPKKCGCIAGYVCRLRTDPCRIIKGMAREKVMETVSVIVVALLAVHSVYCTLSVHGYVF